MSPLGFSMFGKENMPPLFNFMDSMENSKLRPPSQKWSSDTKSIFSKFSSEQYNKALRKCFS